MFVSDEYRGVESDSPILISNGRWEACFFGDCYEADII
jgi:hypothetical protein